MHAEGLRALPDVLTLLNERVLDTQLPRRVKAHLLAKLADLEYRCAAATSEKLQLSALVSAFVAARFAGAGRGAMTLS